MPICNTPEFARSLPTCKPGEGQPKRPPPPLPGHFGSAVRERGSGDVTFRSPLPYPAPSPLRCPPPGRLPTRMILNPLRERKLVAHGIPYVKVPFPPRRVPRFESRESTLFDSESIKSVDVRNVHDGSTASVPAPRLGRRYVLLRQEEVHVERLPPSVPSVPFGGEGGEGSVGRPVRPDESEVFVEGRARGHVGGGERQRVDALPEAGRSLFWIPRFFSGARCGRTHDAGGASGS